MAEERGPVLSFVIEGCDELRVSDEKIVPSVPEKKTAMGTRFDGRWSERIGPYRSSGCPPERRIIARCDRGHIDGSHCRRAVCSWILSVEFPGPIYKTHAT